LGTVETKGELMVQHASKLQHRKSKEVPGLQALPEEYGL
jgi:ribosomal protein L10